MTVVFSAWGQRDIANRYTDGLSLYCHLARQPITPTVDSQVSDFLEVNAVWYQPKQVRNWTVAVTVSGVAVVYADPLLWQVGAVVQPLNVYGYWMTYGLSTTLEYAEAVVGPPIPMRAQGAQCAVFPRLSFTSQPPCGEQGVTIRQVG